jgi:hypothetical protein
VYKGTERQKKRRVGMGGFKGSGGRAERKRGWGRFGWVWLEWRSKGGVEGWGGVREVTLLINDRASSSIERWRARHYSSCAFPRRWFFHLSLLSLYHSTSTFYTPTHAHTKHSLLLTLF